jgi:hypothetical protein
MSAESRKRTMRFESVGTVPLPLPRAMIYWWSKAFFVLARMSLSALSRSKQASNCLPPSLTLLIVAFAAPHDDPTPSPPKHASLSHHNVAQQPHTSRIHHVFRLLDASLAREQLDSSSASQCEEGSTLDSQPAGLPNPTHFPNSAAPAVSPTIEQIGSTIICDNFEG